jgi:hypothetical protein
MRISSVVSWYHRRVLEDEMVGEEGVGSARWNEDERETSEGRSG